MPTFFQRLGLCLLIPAVFGLTGCKNEPSRTAAISTVQYIRVEPVSVTLTRELPGRTSPFVVSEVRPQVSGIIRERLFTEGADVQAGQVLYQIDDALYQAAHNRARAALMEAEANLNAARLLSDRSARLVQTKAISRQDYDNAVSSRGQSEARVAAARAELETAAINLEYTKVTSPVHGRIGSSAVTPGALVTQNQAAPLAIVQQLDPIYVDITQSSSELLRLREAMDKGTLSRSDAFARVGLILENGKPYVSLKPVSEAEQSPDADVSSLYVSRFEEEPVHGSLEFSDVTVDQSTGVIRMRALFPNPDLILLPGMYVRLVLEEGVRNAAILLPQRAVQRDNRGQAVVWVLTPVPTPALAQEGAQGEDLFLAEQRILLLDRALDNQWLVSGGLKAGELVLVEGISKIRAGRPVKAEEYRPQAPADVAQAPSGGN